MCFTLLFSDHDVMCLGFTDKIVKHMTLCSGDISRTLNVIINLFLLMQCVALYSNGVNCGKSYGNTLHLICYFLPSENVNSLPSFIF